MERITVSQLEVNIKHDVDYNTGNIDSRNSVIIHGAVQPGFKVNTLGSQKGNNVCHSDKQCQHSDQKWNYRKITVISSLGDVNFSFIEQGHVDSGGNVIIRRQPYYSNISAKGDIGCKPGSTIIGGKIIAGGHLTVDNVGSQNGGIG